MARSCWSSDLSIACSVAAAARFGRESEAGRDEPFHAEPHPSGCCSGTPRLREPLSSGPPDLVSKVRKLELNLPGLDTDASRVAPADGEAPWAALRSAR